MAIILIIDDRPVNREFLVTLLGYSGHQLLEAANGEEGLAITRAQRPDLIIADIVMPTMDGYEFARQVRADPDIHASRIIFYTSSYVVAETRRLAEACGVKHIITKPAEPEMILKTVEAALRTEETPQAQVVSENFHREHMRLLTDTLAKKVEDLEAQIAERKQAEAALANNEKRFRALIEHSSDAISLLGADGRLIYLSPSHQNILGHSPEDLIGADPATLTHPDDLTALLALLTDLIQNPGHTATTQYRMRHKDGTWHWIESSINNLLAEPSVGAIVFNYRDITERKNTVAQLEFQANVLANINDAVVVADDSLNIVSWNHAAEVMYGWDTDKIKGRGLTEVLNYKLTETQTSQAALTLLKGEPFRAEVVVENQKTGHQFYVDTNTISLLDQNGMVTGVVSVNRDITERKNAEAQIRRQLDYLAALRTVDTAITSSFDLKMTLNVILDVAMRRLGVDAVSILLVAPHFYTLEYAAGRGFRSDKIEKVQVRFGENLAGQAVIEQHVITIPDINNLPFASPQLLLLKDERFVSYYGVPLVNRGAVKGVLEIFNRATLSPDKDWLIFLESLGKQAAIAIDNAQLFEGLQRSNSELSLAYDATIEGWSKALDFRDKETEGHSQRVTALTLHLAKLMNYRDEDLVHVRRGALLHDIGKMGIPDSILLKPGKLTDEEWQVMRKHPGLAYEMLSPIAYLHNALDIPYCHHEKWDGSGYPRGLKGEEIPLSARIFAVVDVWDALRSDRPYRTPWTEERVREHIREQSGIHFDPKVVDAFLRLNASQFRSRL